MRFVQERGHRLLGLFLLDRLGRFGFHLLVALVLVVAFCLVVGLVLIIALLRDVVSSEFRSGDLEFRFVVAAGIARLLRLLQLLCRRFFDTRMIFPSARTNAETSTAFISACSLIGARASPYRLRHE